ncbi:LacI family DNA-binding transcriptional regulator [Cohnella algarum]|uniref:LacI family DNA-binding transcriptional regulator n=1 Tax=Cohnella algarum TaxID=2044859 RepID=UPI001967B974|nr:LacI family DNA-binding transcriptional regulator [Cohnella algarum]MBN2982100.1 LacI family DNA-binding transcriptional regulator [Cohnella algarum]
MKKMTMKDIARAAGVSTATVSYIMNNVETQSISPETREKVMKAAQQLNYIRNISARSLKSGKSELIGVVLPDPEDGPAWQRYKYAQAAYRLGRHLNRYGYQPIAIHVDPSSPKLDVILEREMDGVFVFDVSERDFLRISGRYGMGIPVMAVDSCVKEPIFHKLLPDFAGAFAAAERALGAAPQFLITDEYRDPELSGRIERLSGLSAGDIHVYRDEEALRRFVRERAGQAGIAVNEFVGLSALRAEPALRLAAVCTCGCPELLPERTPKIRFDPDGYRKAAELIVHYIRKPHEARPEEFVFLSVLP